MAGAEAGVSGAGIQQQQHSAVAAAAAGPGDESSDSEGEHEGPQKLIRKVSTSGQIRTKTSIKEGLLLKQTSSFQRWKKRYFKLRGRTLYYAKDSKSLIFDEVDLSDASVAESSTKNVNNSFTIITPFRRLILCAENRKEMEDWISSLKSVQSREHYETAQFNVEHFSGMHNWYACSHARPTFCNVCRESLSGVTSHGLSCEVCKFKAHKRCAVRATNNCKWTTLASIGKDIIEDEDGIAMPHQWLEGNLPVSAKCAVCDKTCGSVLRLQDWKCLWCKAMVHTACRDLYPRKCPLGQCKVSIIPPTALNSIDSDGFWKATCPPSCASPLLVFVNSKSGDNQGVKFLRRFKQSLNPAQVFDLMNGGPHLGLRLFQKFDNFRILVCGGDGSVGWVLSEIDKLSLHKQCQLGVLPLGTGNDLARVLGWGGSCDDDTQLPQILEKLERASTKMLDRWSIMSYELKLPSKPSILPVTPEEESEECQISAYEDSVAAHLAKILNSDQHSVVISSAKILCETVKDFVAKIGKTYEKAMENADEADSMTLKCSELNEKLDLLLQTLHTESQATPMLPHITPPIVEEEVEEYSSEESLSESKESEGKSSIQKIFKPREQLMLRANSLKKAVRQIIEQAEKVVDEQNAHTEEQENQSALEYSKELEECKEEEKEEDTREHEFQSSLRAGLAASIAGSSIISKMLLANIDPFGATPFIDPDPDSLEGYSEKCVMNNYFGIGLDAKISLEFNNKREEHPEKCRSRTKNMMWYGVLGTKELLQRTYKNLEQKVQLECDGQYIPLPSLQGIAVLNIPSYAGGTNFWGGTKEDDIFGAPSFDDKILEVVAVFGSMQMAVSRVIKLQHHRIAQCRSVKITILGDEGVPVQVDGEAWIQPPGVIKIVHKNRAQMLTRDRAFESTLKSWEDKQKCDSCKPVLRSQLYPQQAIDLATEEEVAQIQLCSQAAEELITRICEAAKTHSLLEQELAHAVNACSHALNKANPRFSEVKKQLKFVLKWTLCMKEYF
ncbi:PREDICTED: diacylglycerol kinase eta isoform X2 [Gavialis gangeticus]|uniref:diacylglycerol kinase eta isoform X2 n=1 Tax=Gavialis gangeticus TaxID=94835 RepID=UPI00092E6FC6|nr:PREDICTED: diacylglycerol kinase eta isoform X2 [Gavialis gangeticus]